MKILIKSIAGLTFGCFLGLIATIAFFRSENFRERAEYTLLKLLTKLINKDLIEPPSYLKREILSLIFDDANGDIYLNYGENKYFHQHVSLDSNPEILIAYLTKHPNERVSINEINEVMNLPIKTSLSQTVTKLGFSGLLRELFFTSSKNAIIFRNPITREFLQKRDITEADIRNELQTYTKLVPNRSNRD